MENKNINTFIKVVEFNNFTKAAEHLGYSQAAVTAQIKALENELGVLLFDRIGKRIQLTQEGKVFLPYAHNMLKAEEEAINSVRVTGDLKGELRVCAGSSYAMGVLPEILLKYKEQHPGVNVIVKISDYPEDTTQKLARGDIDFLVCMDEENTYPEFLTVAKKPEQIIFVTYPANPILKNTSGKGAFGQQTVALADIVKNQFITADRDIGYCALLEKELRKRGIEAEPVMEMGSVGAIVNVLLGGYGTSFIPRFMAEKYLESGELVEIKTEKINIELYSYYICSRHRWLNPIMQEFIKTVEEQHDKV